jgi:hypothetical protein
VGRWRRQAALLQRMDEQPWREQQKQQQQPPPLQQFSAAAACCSGSAAMPSRTATTALSPLPRMADHADLILIFFDPIGE